MSNIIFLNVDAEDRLCVKSMFPDAQVHTSLPEGKLVEVCKDTKVLSTFLGTQFSEALLKKLPNLKLLCTRSVGTDHIDLDACKKQGIMVCNVPDYGSHVIAEHVFALLLSAIRHIPEADLKVELGVFDYHGLRGMSLRNKTIGIVGTGKIGRAVARIAHGFGMSILAHDIAQSPEIISEYKVQYVDRNTLFQKSDIITLHAPSVSETYHMLNSSAFSSMKEGVIIVNTARGELINSDALLHALESEKVAYALLDVLEHEQNFEENKALIKHPHAITTPHIAFYAEESMKNMYEDCFQSILQWQSGITPDHVV